MLVAKSSQWAAVIKIFNFDLGKDELYLTDVLPFGASAAVFGFNRFARAIQRIGIRLFFILWTNFFDDYPHLDLKSMGQESATAAERLMDLLGWEVSKEPVKRKVFAESFNALGVQVDFSESRQLKVKIRNKPSRVVALREVADQVLASGEFPHHVALSYRGKLQHAEGQFFATIAALMMPEVRARAGGSCPGKDCSPGIKKEILWSKSFLSTAEPRILLAGDPRPPVLIFTDAALEGQQDDTATYGAIIFDGGESEFFQGSFKPEHLAVLQKETKKVITVLEVLPAVAAASLWKERLLHRRTFFFIDNDAARAGLIKVHSSVETISKVLLKFAVLLAEWPSYPWFSRVASASNCADRISRLKEPNVGMPSKLVSADMDQFFDNSLKVL